MGVRINLEAARGDCTSDSRGNFFLNESLTSDRVTSERYGSFSQDIRVGFSHHCHCLPKFICTKTHLYARCVKGQITFSLYVVPFSGFIRSSLETSSRGLILPSRLNKDNFDTTLL